MKKPTPEELAQLRELFPKGAPRFDYRAMTLTIDRAETGAAGAPAADNGVIPIAISSEQPVLRYDWWDDIYYYEVLDHSAKSVVLDYCADGMPFVASHRSRDADQQHGIVENVTVGKDRILRGDMRASRAQRSQEIAQDMRDGIRRKVSVGYIVGDEYDQTEKAKDGIPIRRYTAWMPIECSTVPIPADYTVGVGRVQSAEGRSALERFLQLVPPAEGSRAAAPVVPPVAPQPPAAAEAKERTMPEDNAAPSGPPNTNAGPASGAPIVTNVAERAAENAAQRVDNIISMAAQHGCQDKVSDWLRSGATELTVAGEINKILGERLKQPIQTTKGPDITPKDAQRFSFARAIMAHTELESECRKSPGGSKIDFGFEREMLQEVARHGGAQKSGNILPFAMLGRAGIDSGVATTGGPFKFTQPGEFIPMLRNKTSVIRAGSTMLTGLTGPVTFPKQTSAAGIVWSAENPGSDISVTNLLTTTVTLSFKSVAAGTAFSRQMLFSAASGNYDMESIIQNDLTAVIGLGIDLAALNGLGSSNQPKGLLKNTLIGSVTLGANGGSAVWNNWVDLETKIGQANADTKRMAYLTNSAQRGAAKKVGVLGNTASGVPIWTGNVNDEDGVVNGYRAIASEQVPSNLTKGTSTTICSAIVFGAWEHQLIGMFGAGFETIVDPYSKKYQGMVEVAAWSYVDCAQRYDGAFSAIQDAL